MLKPEGKYSITIAVLILFFRKYIIFLLLIKKTYLSLQSKFEIRIKIINSL